MPKITQKKQHALGPSDYCRDIAEWPKEWTVINADMDIGRGLLALFTPFVQHLIDDGLAKKTIQNHANHLFLLGREIIERLNDNDDDKRKLSPGDLILHYVDDEGGPLLSFWSPDIKSELAQHMAYDSTCRKLLKFLERSRT
jgi:hypothetical protein